MYGAHPRSRGENRPLRRWRHRRMGLIPAHAGKTTRTRTSPWSRPAHPRSRGENHLAMYRQLAQNGSSPLTRGKRRDTARGGIGSGLIPAHAGKTVDVAVSFSGSPAHPRSRGENDYLKRGSFISPGSSPLTRGKLRADLEVPVGLRLIPAHAGKTWQEPRRPRD